MCITRGSLTRANTECHAHAQEITRRVNLRDVWQAAYTAGRVLPKPVATCQYWHRSLDPKKVRVPCRRAVGLSRTRAPERDAPLPAVAGVTRRYSRAPQHA